MSYENRGGYREGSGRPPEFGEKMISVQLNMPKWIVDELRNTGNMSETVRNILFKHFREKG